MSTLAIVQQYYQFFNQKNWAGMLSLVDTEIRHETNQGEVRTGHEKFTSFLQKMDECYDENLTDMLFFTEPSNHSIAVEFTVNGIYKKGDDDLPPAHHQTYILPAAAFLVVKDDKITRITTYYNIPHWIELVSK